MRISLAETQHWFCTSAAPLPSKFQCTFPTRADFGPAGNTRTESSALPLFVQEVCHEVFLIIFRYFHLFRGQMCDSDATMYGSLQKHCSYAAWRHPWQNGKSHTSNPFNSPHIFPCNSAAQGDNWLKSVIKTVSAFSLWSPAFNALCTQPGVPVSRCCILLIECVNQYRLAEAMSYIKRQMFNNEPRKVVQRAWTQLHDGKKGGSSLPHQCVLTLPMFSWKFIYVAPFLALTHWLNTLLLIWIAAFVCWVLTVL